MSKRRKATAEYADEQWFKLARRLFRSSIWEEDPATRIVWITLLHLAQLPENRKHGRGVVLVTRGNLCREAFVTAEQLEHALDRLRAPDPTSRTEPGEGRIDVLPNGYRVRSFDRYHDADEFEAWRAQRVKAGKAREKKARRSEKGRFTSGKPATAGNGASDRWSETSKTRRDGEETRGEETNERTEPCVPSESPAPGSDEPERAELVAICREIASRQGLSLTAVIERVSAIPPGNGHPGKSFTDPRTVSISWICGALGRARDLLAELERPLSL